MTAAVRLVSNSAAIRKAVKEALAPTRVVARGASTSTKPTRGDMVVTTGRLTSGVEYLAASFGTPHVVVLPEAAAYLADWLARRHEPGVDAPVLIGADLANHERMATAAVDRNHAEEVEL